MGFLGFFRLWFEFSLIGFFLNFGFYLFVLVCFFCLFLGRRLRGFFVCFEHFGGFFGGAYVNLF